MSDTVPLPKRSQARRPARVSWVRILVVFLGVVALAALGYASWYFLMPHGGEQGDAEAQSFPSALNSINVSGRVGATPAVDVHREVSVTAQKKKVVVEGTGREITENAPVLLSVTAFDGSTGEILSPQGRPRLTSAIVGEPDNDRQMVDLVVGEREGTRILAVRPVRSGESSSSNSGMEIDVIDILPTIAEGDEVAEEQNTPVAVTMTPVGPVMDHVGEPPGKVTVQTLIQGNGVQVHSEDCVIAQFSVVGWNDRRVRSSTWNTGVPQKMKMADTMKGLQQALVDQRVGSRLVITVPPDLADGDDTLCIVMDLLGTEPVESSGQGSVSDASEGQSAS